MQRHTAQHLHVKVAHFHRAFAAFAYHCKCLWQNLIQRLASGNPVFEFLRFCAQLLVVELLVLRLERVDMLDGFAICFKQPVVAAAKDFGEESGRHKCKAPEQPCSCQRGRNPLNDTDSGMGSMAWFNHVQSRDFNRRRAASSGSLLLQRSYLR